MNPYVEVTGLSKNPNYEPRQETICRNGKRYTSTVYVLKGATTGAVVIPQRPGQPSNTAFQLDPAKLAEARAWADEMRRTLTSDES